MTLDVEHPDPPDLTNRGLPAGIDPEDGIDAESDLHRSELEGILRDGAWQEGFDEWADYTGMDERAFHRAHDAGLFGQLDFYWDPVEDRLRASAPDVPEDLADLRGLGRELSDLGDVVLETIEDGYVDWSDDDPDFFWDLGSEEGSSFEE